MARGFVYLVAIIDWFTRKVLSWRLSNTLTADFCVDALQEALARFGRPEIFNTDQGAHQRTVHRNSEGSRGAHQYGRSWPLARQRLRRMTVALDQIRRGLLARL